ncbi:Kelch repeat-containing protein [Massilia endophytica]|uniref:Kelch repeat-containing protein n=1 Tax=Massilia endophytica TaxID=2899220 RepID=UPI001E4C1BFE|nr:kelch repeat-containing protein [Massilia endophytica]UGQ46925.1 hypothetical protein LSQ66_00105 [Massilia endophytica]
MHRREALRALAALSLPGGLAACGGGGDGGAAIPPPAAGPAITSFTSDKADYQVGAAATVTAVFSGGTGRIDPPGLAITSGTPLALPILPAGPLRLTVTSGSTSVTRELKPNLAYRNVLQQIPMGFSRAAHVTATGAGGKLYIVGGEGGSSVAPQEVMVFDPYTEKFSSAGMLATGRFAHTVTALPDGTLLVLGGSRTVSGTPSAERFDPATGKTRAMAGQPAANRQYHTATLLADGKVLIAGGQVAGSAAGWRTAEIYDPANDSFTPLGASMQYGRWGHVALPLSGNKVLLYGSRPIVGGYAPAEIYDAAAKTFTAVAGPDAQSRNDARALVLASGEVLLTGGEQADGYPYQSIVRGNADGGNLRIGGQMRHARAVHAAAPLVDGRALIAGGSEDFTSRGVADTELYTPASGAVTQGPQLAVARIMHTADLLATGKVLVLGGNDRSMGLVATAELFS